MGTSYSIQSNLKRSIDAPKPYLHEGVEVGRWIVNAFKLSPSDSVREEIVVGSA